MLVWVRPAGVSVAELRLLTAQHVLRNNKAPSGAYATDIKAWPPGGSNDRGKALTLSLDRELSPNEARPMDETEDFAFLKLPYGCTGVPPPLLPEGECCPGLKDLTLSGYPGGDEINDINGGIVTPATYNLWTLENIVEASARGILSPGMGTPAAGVSGGGVFHNGRYVGMYRGWYESVKHHTFIPVIRIKSWCFSRSYHLVDYSALDDVNFIRSGLAAAAVEKQTQPAVKALVTARNKELEEFKKTLEKFNVYKELHVQLRQVQIQFDHIEIAIRSAQFSGMDQPFEGDPKDHFVLAVDSIDTLISFTTDIINNFEAGDSTFRAREGAWVNQLSEAVATGRKIGRASSMARSACRLIRTLLRSQQPRINVELQALVRSMDLSILASLFSSLRLLPGLGSALTSSCTHSEQACVSLINTLQHLIELHDKWQTVDVSIMGASPYLSTARDGSQSEFANEWAYITDALTPLINTAKLVGTDGWPDTLSNLITDISQALDTGRSLKLESDFSHLSQDIRRQFHKVNEHLTRLAGQITRLLNELVSLT